jgi:hypothetical protein
VKQIDGDTFDLDAGLPVRVMQWPTVPRPGEPCGHPGCVSHLSHPCEGCGRYAAGLRDGPDPQAVKARLNELALTHTSVRAALVVAQMRGWTLEQTFGALSLLLVRENEALVKLAINNAEMRGRNG